MGQSRAVSTKNQHLLWMAESGQSLVSIYKMPSFPRKFILSHHQLHFVFSLQINTPLFSSFFCTGYRLYSLPSTYHIPPKLNHLNLTNYINFKMLSKIFLIALAACPLVAAHGKVAVVVSCSWIKDLRNIFNNWSDWWCWWKHNGSRYSRWHCSRRWKELGYRSRYYCLWQNRYRYRWSGKDDR